MPRKKKEENQLTEQAAEILAMAEARGVQSNYFFKTTFQRYQVQLQILADLEKDIKANGMTVEKTYVKGAGNKSTNPSITEFNKTSTAANGTVITLMKIINGFAKEDKGAPKSRLEALMQEAND